MQRNLSDYEQLHKLYGETLALLGMRDHFFPLDDLRIRYVQQHRAPLNCYQFTSSFHDYNSILNITYSLNRLGEKLREIIERLGMDFRIKGFSDVDFYEPEFADVLGQVLSEFKTFCESDEIKNAIIARLRLLKTLEGKKLTIDERLLALDVITDQLTLETLLQIRHNAVLPYNDLAREYKLPSVTRTTSIIHIQPNPNNLSAIVEYLTRLQTIHPVVVYSRTLFGQYHVLTSDLIKFVTQIHDIPPLVTELMVGRSYEPLPNMTLMLSLLLETLKTNPHIKGILNLDSLVREHDSKKVHDLLVEIREQLQLNQAIKSKEVQPHFKPATKVMQVYKLLSLTQDRTMTVHLKEGFDAEEEKRMTEEQVLNREYLKLIFPYLRKHTYVEELARLYGISLAHQQGGGNEARVEFDLYTVDIEALHVFLSTVSTIQPILFSQEQRHLYQEVVFQSLINDKINEVMASVQETHRILFLENSPHYLVQIKKFADMLEVNSQIISIKPFALLEEAELAKHPESAKQYAIELNRIKGYLARNQQRALPPVVWAMVGTHIGVARATNRDLANSLLPMYRTILENAGLELPKEIRNLLGLSSGFEAVRSKVESSTDQLFFRNRVLNKAPGPDAAPAEDSKKEPKK